MQIDENGKQFVFVLKKEQDNYVVKKNLLKIGKEYNGVTEILEGLSVNDKLINEGARSVSEGQKVTIK